MLKSTIGVKTVKCWPSYLHLQIYGIIPNIHMLLCNNINQIYANIMHTLVE